LGDVLEQLKGRTSFLVQGNNLTVNDCILDIECSNRISARHQLWLPTPGGLT